MRYASLVALSIAACHPKASAPPDAGEPRVVSISPSTTEALFAIGAGPDVVGRSRFCDRPEAAKALPVVGGFSDPDLEAILALHPGLVVGARGPSGPSITEKLAAYGVATYFPETDSLAGIDAMLLGLGERTGHAAGATAVVDGMHARERAIEAAVADAGGKRARLLLVFDAQPIYVAGPGTFLDELVAKAGAANAMTDGGRYPAIDVERLIALDPDVVVDASAAGGTPIDRRGPGWKDLRARFERIDDEALLRPGPRAPDAIALLARVAHPGVAIP